MCGLETSTLNGRIGFEDHVEFVARGRYRMRGFESTEAAQSRIVAAVAVVNNDMIIGAFVVRFDFEFVEHLMGGRRKMSAYVSHTGR